MQSRLHAIAFAIFLVAFHTACDGKPCTDPPEYDESDEQVNEQLDELLDSADAYEHQRRRVFEAHDALAADKQKMRTGYEATRAKLVDALVATTPDPNAFHTLIDEMKGVFMPYTYAVVDIGIGAHRWFTNEQRAGIAEEYDQDPEDFNGSWAVDRGIDVALMKIDATDPQKTLVKGWRDKMVVATDKLYKDQNKLRKALLAQWKADDIDPNAVRKHIDTGAGQISAFLHLFGDGAMEVTQALTPQQRMWTNKQVNKMRRCQ